MYGRIEALLDSSTLFTLRVTGSCRFDPEADRVTLCGGVAMIRNFRADSNRGSPTRLPRWKSREVSPKRRLALDAQTGSHARAMISIFNSRGGRFGLQIALPRLVSDGGRF
jgi:hypothetical protein